MDERITNRGIQRATAKVENGKSEQFYETALNSNHVHAIVTHRRHRGVVNDTFYFNAATYFMRRWLFITSN